jgi:hypothetical protein
MHGLVNCEARVRKGRRKRHKMVKEGVKEYVAVLRQLMPASALC